MAEVAFEHDTKGFSGSGLAGCHFYRRGHEVADGSCSRVHMAERHLSQYVALGEDSRDTVFVVDDGYRADVKVEHFMDGIGNGGFHTHCSNFPVAKFQYAHQAPPPSPRECGS